LARGKGEGGPGQTGPFGEGRPKIIKRRQRSEKEGRKKKREGKWGWGQKDEKGRGSLGGTRPTH